MMGGIIFLLASVSMMMINTIALVDEDSTEACSRDLGYIKIFLFLSISIFVSCGISVLFTLDIRMPELQKHRNVSIMAWIGSLIAYYIFTWSLTFTSHQITSCRISSTVLNGNLICGHVVCGIPLAVLLYLSVTGQLKPLLNTKSPDYVQLSQIARPKHVRGF